MLSKYPEADIERAARELKPTSHGVDCKGKKHRLDLVTQALSVAKAEIYLESELAAKALTESGAVSK